MIGYVTFWDRSDSVINSFARERMATRTLQCSICQNDFKDPRLLPCIHSFCLECLEDYCRDKLPGDNVPCPECKSQFLFPNNGAACLRVSTHFNDPATSSNCEASIICETCEACSTEHQSVPATLYCEDCCQKLCANCGTPHKKMKRGPHDVVPLESANPEIRSKRYCEKHEDERIKMYCFDCNMNMCSMCCLEEHNTHQFEQTQKVINRFSKSIDDEIERVTSSFERFRAATTQIKAENNTILEHINDMEQDVMRRSQNLVIMFAQLVENEANDILDQLQLLKSSAEEELNSHTDTLHLAESEMEHFRTSSLELSAKSSPSDITQAANDVHERAKELLETFVIPREYHAPSYKFTPVNSDELLRDGQRFVGHVVEIRDSGNVYSYWPPAKRRSRSI